MTLQAAPTLLVQAPASRSWTISLHLITFQPTSWCLGVCPWATSSPKTSLGFLTPTKTPLPLPRLGIQWTHIRGRGWLKARERALLELLDDFKPELKLSKVKHTSQDLCLDFSRFLPCHIRECLCQKWRQALTNKLKKRWRSNRSSWSLIMLLCVQFKNTRESASPLRRHIRFFLVPSLSLRVSLTREIIQYSSRVSRVHSTRA